MSLEHHGISNHRQIDWLINSLFRLTAKRPSTLLTLCEGNPLVISGFPSQRDNTVKFPCNDVIMHREYCIFSPIFQISSLNYSIWHFYKNLKYSPITPCCNSQNMMLGVKYSTFRFTRTKKIKQNILTSLILLTFAVILNRSPVIFQFPYNMAVINVGAPACGMNAAMRAFVRLSLTNGYGVMGIRFGFEGLVQDNVSVKKIGRICGRAD